MQDQPSESVIYMSNKVDKTKNTNLLQTRQPIIIYKERMCMGLEVGG